jgi:hypothetical protein
VVPVGAATKLSSNPAPGPTITLSPGGSGDFEATGSHKFLSETTLILVYDSTLLDIDEKIPYLSKKVERGGFDLKL